MEGLTALELEAVRLSLQVAVAAVVLGLPPALAVGWLLARRMFPGKALVEAVVYLPLVLPPVAVGYLLLVVFGRRGPVGGWLSETLGFEIAFTWRGAAIASAVVAFPLMVRAVRLAAEGLDPGLEAAARTLGAGRIDAFRTVSLPLMAPGLLAASVLGFARSLGEFGATITFVASIPGETRTIPIAIYGLIQTPGGEDAAARLLVLSILLAVGALAVSEWLARRVRRNA